MAIAATRITIRAEGADSADELHSPKVSAYFSTGSLGGTTAASGAVEAGATVILPATMITADDIFCVHNDGTAGTITIDYTDGVGGANTVVLDPDDVAVLPNLSAATVTIASSAGTATGSWALIGTA